MASISILSSSIFARIFRFDLLIRFGLTGGGELKEIKRESARAQVYLVQLSICFIAIKRVILCILRIFVTILYNWGSQTYFWPKIVPNPENILTRINKVKFAYILI